MQDHSLKFFRRHLGPSKGLQGLPQRTRKRRCCCGCKSTVLRGDDRVLQEETVLPTAKWQLIRQAISKGHELLEGVVLTTSLSPTRINTPEFISLPHSLLESVQNEHLQGNRHAQAPPHQRVIRMQNEGTSEDIRIGQVTGMISNCLRSGAAASR